MTAIFPLIFVGWKLFKKTRWLKPHEVVVKGPEVDEIDEYTNNYVERVPRTRWHGYVNKLFD
jgi:amino acid transporter